MTPAEQLCKHYVDIIHAAANNLVCLLTDNKNSSKYCWNPIWISKHGIILQYLISFSEWTTFVFLYYKSFIFI